MQSYRSTKYTYCREATCCARRKLFLQVGRASNGRSPADGAWRSDGAPAIKLKLKLDEQNRKGGTRDPRPARAHTNRNNLALDPKKKTSKMPLTLFVVLSLGL
jgi:hypothetical protein